MEKENKCTDVIDMTNSNEVSEMISRVHKTLSGIVAISDKLVKNGSRKYFTCEDMVRDPDMTYLLLSTPVSAEAYNSRMNKCFIEHGERNMFDYIANCIGKVSTGDVSIEELIKQFNDLFKFVIENFDAAAVYKTLELFDKSTSPAVEYLDKDLMLDCMYRCYEKGGSPIISVNRLPVNSSLYDTFTTADGLYEFVKNSSVKCGFDDCGTDSVYPNVKTTMTSMIILALSSKMDSAEVAKFYNMYRDEFVKWVKGVCYDKTRATIAYSRENFPLMKSTDFNKLFIYTYSTLMDAGDVNSVIKTYEDSIEGQTDEVLLADVKENIDAIRHLRYSMTQIFVEIFSNEYLIHEVIPTVFALHVLKTRTPKNTAAYQIQMLVKSIFIMHEFSTQRMNDYYVHYTMNELCTDEDVLFAKILSFISSFNSSTSDYLSSAYSIEAAHDIKYFNKLTFTRFIGSIKQRLLKCKSSDDDTYDASANINTVDDLYKYADYLIEASEKAIDTISDSENQNPDDESYIPFYKDKVSELESIKNSLDYAVDMYTNNTNEIDRLLNNIETLSDVELSYNSSENAYRLEYDVQDGADHTTVVENIIWPSRVIDKKELEERIKNDVSKSDTTSSRSHNQAINNIKPGDIFKERKTITVKSGCK